MEGSDHWAEGGSDNALCTRFRASSGQDPCATEELNLEGDIQLGFSFWKAEGDWIKASGDIYLPSPAFALSPSGLSLPPRNGHTYLQDCLTPQGDVYFRVSCLQIPVNKEGLYPPLGNNKRMSGENCWFMSMDILYSKGYWYIPLQGVMNPV